MKEFTVAMIIILVVLAIIFGPLAFIWSLNVLFPSLAIPYTFKTWAASAFFCMLFGAKSSYLQVKE
jgi:hypothetical protein